MLLFAEKHSSDPDFPLIAACVRPDLPIIARQVVVAAFLLLLSLPLFSVFLALSLSVCLSRPFSLSLSSISPHHPLRFLFLLGNRFFVSLIAVVTNRSTRQNSPPIRHESLKWPKI
jgi:hypothetical protein